MQVRYSGGGTRPLYGLKDPPRSAGKPLNNYRLEINAIKHTGGIAETIGKRVPDISATTSEGDITAEVFKIGDRNFVRLGVNTPLSVATQLLEKSARCWAYPSRPTSA